QTFWMETADPRQPFRLVTDGIDELRTRFPVVLAHGVTSPVGGSQPPSADMARLFAESVRRLGAQLASEHLSFNRASGDDGPFGSAFFLPPRQTPGGVEAAVAAIAALRADLDVPFSFETPVSYLQPRADEIPDGAFVAAVAEAADCGILLDLHNIWTNERNGRQSAREYLAQLPLERVSEVHLAGGLERDGFWLDAHSGGLAPELEALAAEVLPQLPELRVVVYEILPEFVVPRGERALRPVLERIHRLVDDARRASSTPVRGPVVPPATRGPHTVGDDRPAPSPTPTGATSAVNGRGAVAASERPAAWEHVLASLAIGRSPSAAGTVGLKGPARVEGDRVLALGAELSRDPGVALLRELVGAGRDGRVASSLPLTVELLLVTIGRSGLAELLARYAAETTPTLWASAEGTQFAAWAREALADHPIVLSALALDLAGIELMRTEHPQTVEIDVDPMLLISAIRTGASVADVPTGRFLATIG
ncbi:MAG: multinuclear nonheme iron-dependent oxidase, partial [Acidimicrobiales bacterium]